MRNQNLFKKTMIGIGSFTILLSAAWMTSHDSVQAASVQAVQIQAVSSSASQKKADRMIAKAKSLIGKVKYKYGVNDASKLRFDCSAFTKYIFASEGIRLKWGSTAQSKQGIYVAKNKLQKGDLIFFSVNKSGRINHVGMYIDNGKFIHNTTGSVNGVTISDLNSASYQKRYITARRVL